MVKRAVMVLLLNLSAASAFAAGSVRVLTSASEKPKTLTGAEHLLDLVGQLRLSNSRWPGAVISKERAAMEAGCQQRTLLARLATLVAEESGDDAAAINALRQQIQTLKVADRQMTNLNPDVVRVSERGNPPLQDNHALWVGAQPAHITLLGLPSHPGKQPFMPERDAASYLNGQSRLSSADRSLTWVIHPDGRTQKVPIAYWNKRHVEPMPGGIIYVGLSDATWSSTPDKINVDIFYTLTQRISEQ